MTVHSCFRRPIDAPLHLWLRSVHADPRVGPQSLTVSLRKQGRRQLGVIYEGVSARSWRFWTDDPLRQNPGPILCVPPAGGTELFVYNGWLMPNGYPDEWFGDAGMLIDQVDRDTFRLRCSRGGARHGGPDFSSLELELRVAEADLAEAKSTLRTTPRAMTVCDRHHWPTT